MVLVLPKKKDGLAEVEKSLTRKQWKESANRFKHYQVDLRLPKFQMENTFGLGQELAALGMPLPFSDSADLSGISSESLKINNVVHKTYIDVKEKGAEAAAATAVILAHPRGNGPGDQHVLPLVLFHVDRPFFLLIREYVPDAILFMGRVIDPRGK